MASHSLREITRKRPSKKVWETALQKLADYGDDRSLVVTASAYVEYGLERLIKTRLRRLPRAAALDIFDGTGPLATFSAKIRIAFALGAIGPRTRHDLETINAIRNVFAHSLHSIRLRDRRILVRTRGMHIVHDLEAHGHDLAKKEFMHASRIYALLLLVRTERAKTLRTRGVLSS